MEGRPNSGHGAHELLFSLIGYDRGIESGKAFLHVQGKYDRYRVQVESQENNLQQLTTGLPNKACPRLRDLATAPARGISQPRTNLIWEPCRFASLCGHSFCQIF